MKLIQSSQGPDRNVHRLTNTDRQTDMGKAVCGGGVSENFHSKFKNDFKSYKCSEIGVFGRTDTQCRKSQKSVCPGHQREQSHGIWMKISGKG